MNFKDFALCALAVLTLAGGLPAAGKSPYALTVALDGSGAYKSLQEAINAATAGTASLPTVIHLKPGIYKEVIYLQREKRYLHLVGDDASRTIVTFNLNANMPGTDGKPLGTFRTPSTEIDADDFTAENITFENSAGPVGQALAVRIDGDRAQFHHCRFLGWQDTILANRGRHYFDQCTVTGSVDFIFGGATAVFDHCTISEIRDTGGALTAPSTPQEQPFGFVFLHCTVKSTPNVHPNSTALMRPWRPGGMAAFIDCTLDNTITPAAWKAWDGREATCRALEFGSTAPDGKPVDTSKRAAWSHQLTAQEAAQYTLARIFTDWNPASKG